MRQTGLRIGMRRSRAGFTLVELMVTIFVAAILMAIAVPSFKHAINSTHLRGASNDLLAALTFARAESVRRGSQVAVEASSSGNWSDGWSVVASAATAGGSSTVLRHHDALRSGYQLSIDPGGTTQVAFRPGGSLAKPAGNSACFTLTATHDAHNEPSHIMLLPSGSIHSTKGSSCASSTP